MLGYFLSLLNNDLCDDYSHFLSSLAPEITKLVS
jgi:hypothetical protein